MSEDQDNNEELSDEEIEELLVTRGIIWENLRKTSDDLPAAGSTPPPFDPKKKKWKINRTKQKKRRII